MDRQRIEGLVVNERDVVYGRSCEHARRWKIVGFCVLITTGLLITSASASAAVRHDYLSQITEVPTSSGVPLTGPLSAPRALTVDSGWLYVAEHIEGTSDHRVDKFDASSDAFLSQFAQAPSFSFLERGIVVGHVTGEDQIYVAGAENVEGEDMGRVAVFTGAGSFLDSWDGADTPSSEGEPKSFGTGPLGDVAVDNSTSLTDWAAGNVYVASEALDVVDVFKPLAGGGEEYVTQLTGTEPGVPFSTLAAVAVNEANGDVLVSDGSVVDVFEPTVLGEYAFVRTLSETPAGPLDQITGLAADGGTGDIYVAQEGVNVVDEFNASGGYLGLITGTDTPADNFGKPVSVAVDPVSHSVYVGDFRSGGSVVEPGVVDIFGPNIVTPDVAVSPVTNLAATNATLNGTVNPNEAGDATCEFELGTDTIFSQRASCTAAVENGNVAVEVQANVAGLQPDTTYHYRLDATNANGTNTGDGRPEDAGGFTTPGPGLHGASATRVTSDSALLEALINPHNASTTAYFQYGTDSSYGTSVPAPPGKFLGSGEGDQPINQQLSGLAAGITYHYRVVVESELAPGQFEVFNGPDHTFKTQPPGGVGHALPDGRAWEMVSPVDKHGALIYPIVEGVSQSSVDGREMTYLASQPTEAEPHGYAYHVQVLSERGPGGWTSHDIATQHSASVGGFLGIGFEYRFFSSDLSLGLVEPQGPFTSLAPEVSPDDSERTVYLRHNATCNTTPASCYRPLVTGAPGQANVPPGTKFDGDPTRATGADVFVASTPDASHVILSSNMGLTATPGDAGGLYEWAAGKLEVVSVLPESQGGAPAEGSTLRLGGFNGRNVRHAISDDGSRVLWTDGQHLYLRDLIHGETIQLDSVQAGASGNGSANPQFQTASSDGSKVFFTDTQQLTKDSGGLGNEPDLYQCDVVEVKGGLECALSDLTPKSSSERGSALGVLGASDDGSYVYFMANAVLAPGAAAGKCDGQFGSPVGATCNLYVRHAGSTTFIAALSGEDSPDWDNEELTKLTAQVTPSGRWLAFMSQRPLTGYDNHDALSGALDEEVFIYEAAAGRVVCASCNPTGSQPVGSEYGNEPRLVGVSGVWSPTTWIAANIPGWTPYQDGLNAYQSRYLSNDGRLFFNSSDALEPQDANGAEDVYQYEPAGVGSCSTASVTFNPDAGGCVDLISSGTSGEESAFLDASQSGGDVFFLTTAKLVDQDLDHARDVYDAHVCTTGSPCLPPLPLPPPPCSTGDACRPAPSAQPTLFGAPPASSTFSGSGNIAPAPAAAASTAKPQTSAKKLSAALRACRKKLKKKRRVGCEKRARQQYRHAKRAEAALKKGWR